jgi:amylosucrase
MSKWVWTTFNSFQWDLNYANPAVFCAVMKEMFFIVNKGVDILRFDAVPFIWKELGTNCENLPKAHTLVQAFNLAARISTPGLMFKSEAIVHPDEVVKYVSKYECQISYNPTLMALLWESLATRSVKLLNQSLSHRHKLPTLTTWVNYLRCHDDIGWTFDDEDARKVGINAYDHRNFLNQFYTGQFPGSFARGVPFQQNVVTGDMRISGTLASLAGLEQALDLKDDFLIEMACRRIILLNAIALSVGGIPLIYLGEEWGVLNDYDFVKDPAKSNDSRWIHRSKFQWDYFHQLETGDSIRKRLFTSLQQLIELRKQTPAMAGLEMELLGTDNEHVLGFVRLHEGHRLIVLANFTERSQEVDGNKLRMRGLGRFFRDLVTSEEISTSRPLTLDAYRYMWLVAT